MIVIDGVQRVNARVTGQRVPHHSETSLLKRVKDPDIDVNYH